MKMAKASQADLDMGSDLCAAFGALTERWCATMPEAIAQPREGSEIEHFDSDNDEQCGRALRHLLSIVERGSLFRVVMGLAVVLNPRNQCVDPDADTIEHHPDRARLDQVRSALRTYYEALDGRQHGAVAADKALSSIQEALGMSWSDRASWSPIPQPDGGA